VVAKKAKANRTWYAARAMTRYIFTQCLRHKSEALDAVKRVVAEFNAIVGTRLDAHGKPLPRPTVRTIMSDREGKLISHAFNEFRADASLNAPSIGS
jgi:hypothetical protein